MSAALLREKIHRAIDKIEDEHLLEVMFSLVNQNSRFNEYEFADDHFAARQTLKTESRHLESRPLTGEVKKRILAHLEK